MRKILFSILVAAVVFACANQKKMVTENETSLQDSTEYDVEMFDSKFESWYERYHTPASYRQQSYYESWNRQYVAIWNSKANSVSGNFPFEPVVGYDPNEDYGFELNHKLFHYFMYVENVLKIKIMPGGPNFILKLP